MGKLIIDGIEVGGSSSASSASSVKYNNTNSTLVSTNVQGAITELNESLTEQNKNIESCFQSVSSGKASVASAITAKGVTTASDATFETMANNIGKIATTPTNFKNGVFSSGNYTISGLTKNKKYILNIANMNSVTNSSYIKSGGTVSKTVHQLSANKYSGTNSFLATIMFIATSTSVVVQNIGDGQFACWTLIEI